MPSKSVVDPIHGSIPLDEIERKVIDTSVFQRLRRIKQLQMGHLTYPNATHTRFAHSLGVLRIMQRVIEAAGKDTSFTISSDNERRLRLAALLHDVGHYPYSHLMEKVDKVLLTEDFVKSESGDTEKRKVSADHVPYPGHEELGEIIITHNKEMLDVLGGEDEAKQIADLFRRSETADPQLSKLIHSSLDMDRIDFLLRDSRAAGVPYGEIDINYLLNSFRVSKKGMLGIQRKALPAAEQLLLARYFMYRTVYFHKTTSGFEEACRQLLRRIRVRGQDKTGGKTYGLPIDGDQVEVLAKSRDLFGFDDSFVDRIIQKATDDKVRVIQSLARCIAKRRRLPLIEEVFVLSGETHNAGTSFKEHCRYELRSLAKECQLSLGQFLFYESPSLKFEERANRLTESEARDIPPESSDEMIKVFVDDDPEPKSIVSLEHSVLHDLAEKRFQIYRLYLADPNAAEDTIETARSYVSNWKT